MDYDTKNKKLYQPIMDRKQREKIFSHTPD